MADRKPFFDYVREHVFHGYMSQSQVDGTSAILDAWDATAPRSDLRFIACSLGTTYWETDHTMQPIAEIGHGRGHSYGLPAGPWHMIYYGRGDVQETWYANYAKANGKLHTLGVLKPEESLVKNPDLALRPDVAAAIMIHGMLEGWFTGKKLSDFFHKDTAEWAASRTIINGWDHAAEIGNIERQFYIGLLQLHSGVFGIAGPNVGSSAPPGAQA